MNIGKLIAFFIIVCLLLAACQVQQTEIIRDNTVSSDGADNVSQKVNDMTLNNNSCPLQKTVVMKGVGIFTPQRDFEILKSACIDIVTTEWGMEQNVNDVKKFLDRAEKAGLKVVLDGGFSYTAWGFTDDDWDNLPEGKYPVWQKNRVQEWIKSIKDHSAVYAWDICNEYGENLPSGSHAINSLWPETVITLKQLIQAKQDVLEADDSKPILVRMYSWELSEPPFGIDRPYKTGLADIVMINLYSNYAEDNMILWPDVIRDSGAEFVTVVKSTDSNVEVWIALAAFEAPDMFLRPTVKSLAIDIEETLKIPELDGIAFYKWGSEKQPDLRRDWYLPETGADLWDVIKKYISE